MSGLRRTSALALAGGIMLLTGCQDEAGTGSAADGPASSAAAPASVASSAAAASSAGAAERTASPAGDASPSSGSAATGTPSQSAGASPKRATEGAGTPAAHAPTAVAGCRNLTAGDAVKADVTRTYRRDVTHFEHIEPVPHVFFYGQCGTVRYAATRFRPFAGATQAELVGMQDEGSVTKYFRDSGGGWVYVATDGFPVGPHGCGDIPAIPDALATAWGNCSIAP
ncbi:hypothetical protein AB0F46_38190 [Streptomyces sp. NPDC026665]|uniref:hypothetical protein n=1 Tax=Streptomyces sp. NPDC026665 TaxID=3154798 RepID=UPI00340DD06E